MDSVLCYRALADTKRYIEPNKSLGLCLGWVYGNNSQNYPADLSYQGSCYYVTIRTLSSPAHPRIMPNLPRPVPAKQMSLHHLLLHIIQFWNRVSHGCIWPAEYKSHPDPDLQRSLGNVVISGLASTVQKGIMWASPQYVLQNHWLLGLGEILERRTVQPSETDELGLSKLESKLQLVRDKIHEHEHLTLSTCSTFSLWNSDGFQRESLHLLEV